MPAIRENLLMIKVTRCEIHTVKYIHSHSVVINILFLSEKRAGKSGSLARSYFMETAEFTQC